MAQRSKNLQISNPVTYLSLNDLLIIHTDQIERYGGSHGIRDIALLESALFRPQSSFDDTDLYPGFFEKAAVLVLSLLLNHAFVDGNKRTAIASLLVFFEFNHVSLVCSQNQLIKLAIGVENKKWKKEDIASWLENHTKLHKPS